jgi:glycosyltransferase involved in cell wall biosynthesis
MTTRTLLICTPSHCLQGGVERIIESLSAGLPEHDFRVVVGLARGERFHLPDRYRREFPQLDCVEIDGRSGTRAGRVRGVRLALEKVRPDVVLIARLFDAYEAVVAHKALGKPVRLAVTIQVCESEYMADLEPFGDWVDLCVVSGNVVAAAVRRFGRLPEECVVSISGGVRPALRPTVPDDSRPLRLGYVGRLEEAQKRVLDLVDTLAFLVAVGIPFTCQVVGSGPAEGELRRRLVERGLERHVVFHGWLSTERLYEEVYPNLEVLLHFAAWEGMPIAPREAMAHGVVPVVSRFVGCQAEGQFVHGENTLAFDVGNAPQAAAEVARLHENRALLRRLSDAARRSQEGIRSERGAIAAWAEAFTGALKRPARRGPRVPRLPWPPTGRLERWGLPPHWAEALRRWSGRKSLHADPGGEWPHASGLADPARLHAIADFAAAYEAELGRERPALEAALTAQNEPQPTRA